MVADPTASSGSHKDLLACTVYLTKLPGGLTDAKLRRLISYFGEFHKVRMYKEKTPPAIRGGSAASANAFGSNASRGSFGFVEFAAASSAKSMIDYFRNAPMTCAHPFHFLVDGETSSRFTEEELRQLASTRASYAKSAIHDHHPRDATADPISPTTTETPQAQARQLRMQPCSFGLASSLPPGTPEVTQHGQRIGQHQDPLAGNQPREAGLSLGLFDTTGTW